MAKKRKPIAFTAWGIRDANNDVAQGCVDSGAQNDLGNGRPVMVYLIATEGLAHDNCNPDEHETPVELRIEEIEK